MVDLVGRWVTVVGCVRFGEGPVAMTDGRIAFVEVAGQQVTVFDGHSHERLARVPGAPNGLAQGPDGALYVANNGGAWVDDEHRLVFAGDAIDGCIQRVDLDGTVSEFAADLDGPLPHRPNDLCFGPEGRLYFTDSGNWEVFLTDEPGDFRTAPARYRHGALFLRQPDGTVHRLTTIRDFPNGLAITPDGTRIIVAQTVRRRLLAFPLLTDGTVGEPELYAQLPDSVLPDGICFADDGTLYVAGSSGDRVAVLGPDRSVVEVWETGAHTSPTNLCLTEGRLWITLGGGGKLVHRDVEHRPLPLFGAGRR